MFSIFCAESFPVLDLCRGGDFAFISLVLEILVYWVLFGSRASAPDRSLHFVSCTDVRFDFASASRSRMCKALLFICLWPNPHFNSPIFVLIRFPRRLDSPVRAQTHWFLLLARATSPRPIFDFSDLAPGWSDSRVSKGQRPYICLA
jgi:hypothetical protein